ncbi:MAG: SDR family NAD(P)-dependent oxidoreductase [Betaproteobacteria bacterium]
MSGSASYPSLARKVVLITGGGSGIGEAFTEQFWRQGCRVAFFDIDDAASNALVERLADAGAAEKISAAPPRYIRCDITDIDQVRDRVAVVEAALGPVQVLVNNAARDDRMDVFDITPEFWDRTLAVNLRHQFFVTQAVARGMIAAGGGSVIMMGSISWMRGRPGMAGYTTSKAGINGLTRTLARELGDRNVRVNCIVPGAIVTERQKQLWLKPDDDQRFLDLQCLKFRLQPEEVARAALFLASDEARGISGQNLVVDGGIV